MIWLLICATPFLSRRWLDTIDTSSDKSPLGYQIVYKILPRTQKSGHKDSERRLDFVVRQDLGTGRPIGVAWQTFGYKGPKFHDGFLYGEPTSNLEMTGNFIEEVSPSLTNSYHYFPSLPPKRILILVFTT